MAKKFVMDFAAWHFDYCELKHYSLFSIIFISFIFIFISYDNCLIEHLIILLVEPNKNFYSWLKMLNFFYLLLVHVHTC